MAGSSKIVDVNINRLQESLKLIEDIVRFSRTGSHLLNQVRALREEVTGILKKVNYQTLVRARRVATDPGRRSEFDRRRRRDLNSVMIRSFARAKQAARSLEELMGGGWKRIRFRIYELEGVFLSPRFRFDPSFYAVWDGRYYDRRSFIKRLNLLIQSGVTAIQFRFNDIPDRNYLRILKRARKAIPNHIAMIVNNRIDLALAANADGVHLGSTDLPVSTARRIAGDALIIGATVRTVSDLKGKEEESDYLGAGAIFPSPTKPSAAVIGIPGLKRISKVARRPLVAIGGITPEVIKKVFEAGASGVALTSYLFEGDLERNLRSVQKIIRNRSGIRRPGRSSSPSSGLR
ncbi:MAG TPA: thiamine phosphate synthase [bacterium (Candidatus Stahlbacteria)]|nr:thiamine phosphate synthase [Candidatus Stahlbacteria bacterium]